MKKGLLFLLCMVIVTPLCLGITFALIPPKSCEQQTFLPMDGLDPNQVRVDPVTGEPCLFARYQGTVGKPIVVRGEICDDDLFDPNAPQQILRVWEVAENGDELNVPLDPNNRYQLTYVFQTAGRFLRHFGWTDGTDGYDAEGRPNSIRYGSIEFRIYPPNRPPVNRCGGQP